jgi:hypothetical protein
MPLLNNSQREGDMSDEIFITYEPGYRP